MSKEPSKSDVPEIRVSVVHDVPAASEGRYVLYWMTAFRRTAWNFSLQRAVDWAKALGKPLLVVETLQADHRWASERHHALVLGGMADNAARFKQFDVRYYPFVERSSGEATALVAELAARACVVVADDYPIRRFVEQSRQVASTFQVRMERIDANGLLPLRATDQVFATAFALRRFLQKTLPEHLLDFPKPNPLARAGLTRLGGLPRDLQERLPAASARMLSAEAEALAPLPIDHEVTPVAMPGGASAARKRLQEFLGRKLARYATERNHPGLDGTSGLSPYLHVGQIGVHEIFDALARAEDWAPDRLSSNTSGKREGWWGMSESAEGFLDELVTWREVGFNRSAAGDDYDRYESLPDWARETLETHARDRREYVYSLEELEQARTHDELWNAAQTELVEQGRIHNYLRMLWGKKILEWSAHPREALEAMIELNNKYALDGEDPNSYSGIFWVLGRYDRPWGPERPIFGKIRYMSSENTLKKLKLGDYLERNC